MRDDERCKEDARLITFNTSFQVSLQQCGEVYSKAAMLEQCTAACVVHGQCPVTSRVADIKFKLLCYLFEFR